MALVKQNLAIPFSTGIDTKTDPLQVMPTNLIDLQNAVFTLDKRLTKRNGFGKLTALPAGVFPTTLTTFNGNLTAIGNSLQAFNESTATWVNRGRFQPIKLSTLSLVRSSTNQTAADAAISGTLVLSVWADSDGHSKFQVSDSVTGQTLLNPTNLPTTGNQARAYILGNNFVITYLATVGGTPHLQYIAIPVATLVPRTAVDISTQVLSITTGYDAIVVDDTLYISWNGSDGGGAIRTSYLSVNLAQGVTVAMAGHSASLISVASDGIVIWVSFYVSAGTSLYAFALNPILSTVRTQTLMSAAHTLTHITGTVVAGSLDSYSEVSNAYGFSPNNLSDFIQHININQAGTVGSATVVDRSLGLASKSFLFNNVTYMLATYGNDTSFQPTYFLIDSTGAVFSRLAYSNGAGYNSTQVLSNVMTSGTVIQMAYLLKDLLAPISKGQLPNQTTNIYAQTGVNLVTFDLAGTNLVTAEIGNNLNIAGGFLWCYDGTLLNEQGFHLWPEDITATQTTGGAMADQTYFYQVTYEWTDAQGNLMRSAPSIPVEIVVTGGSGNAAVNLEIPTLRLTYKPNVRIVIYRWSTAQQNYYQVTDIIAPTLNNPAVDSILYKDIFSDQDILGNLLIYTTGGVVENIPGPPSANLGLFKSRLMVVSSEDPNLIWYSKQVLEATPVEMSDLFTIYAAPTLSSQGSTGPTTAVSAMDDKFIAFKKDACYYITGTGPDNTGANNDFSDPIFITSTVGCTNQPSIVFTPNGLIFESDKGQWLLGRGLDTQYIGAAVEKFNADFVSSSVGIPGTNQVRLCLNSQRLVLMYDYFYGRWATFTDIDATSSCIYQGLHTFLDSNGQVLQETPGVYTDNSKPVLMAFTTAWMNLMGLQGFQRAYMLYILGQFISPHKLSVSISYDYADGPSQNVLINPTNYVGTWGSIPYWGEGIWGGSGTLEQWRIFLKQQKMQAFQVQVQEQFDASQGTIPGAGLTLSGLNLVVGSKKGFVPLPAGESIG